MVRWRERVKYINFYIAGKLIATINCLQKGILCTVQLTRNLNASLEHEASHSRVEGLALDKILASTHALEHSHSNTASKNSRSTRKVPQRNTTVLCVHNCFAPQSAVSLARLSGKESRASETTPSSVSPSRICQTFHDFHGHRPREFQRDTTV